MIPGEPSTMRVRTDKAGSTTVLRLDGERFTIEEDTHELHERVQSITRCSPCSVVLDLGCVRTLDCCGIGQLVQLYNRVSASGGFFCLANVEQRPKRLLQMLGLLRVFPVFESRDEAITACWSACARACTPASPRREASRQPSGDESLQPAF
jgi:anti-anti-sigma factor